MIYKKPRDYNHRKKTNTVQENQASSLRHIWLNSNVREINPIQMLKKGTLETPIDIVVRTVKIS